MTKRRLHTCRWLFLLTIKHWSNDHSQTDFIACVDNEFNKQTDNDNVYIYMTSVHAMIIWLGMDMKNTAGSIQHGHRHLSSSLKAIKHKTQSI